MLDTLGKNRQEHENRLENSGKMAWNKRSGNRDMKGLAFYTDTDEIGSSCVTTDLGNEKQEQQQNRKQN